MPIYTIAKPTQKLHPINDNSHGDSGHCGYKQLTKLKCIIALFVRLSQTSAQGNYSQPTDNSVKKAASIKN